VRKSGAGNGGRDGLAVPRLEYAPGAGDAPFRHALRRARGPDLSGVVLPSPRRPNSLARIDPHFRNASGTSVPARRSAAWRDQKKGRKNVGRPQYHPKPDVVAVVWLIPVAIGAAGVISVVVERAAAHDLSRPPGRVPAPGMIAKKTTLRAAGEVFPHSLQSRSPEMPESRVTKQGRTAIPTETRR